jgi:glyoxylase I family protein
MSHGNAKIGGGGFHHVAIKVARFDDALRFYTDGLGFAVKAIWGEGDARGTLLDTGDGNYLEIFAGGLEAEGEHPRIFHFALRTADTDAAHAVALAAGAVETMAPKDVVIPSTPPIPIRISFVRTPTGESVEFFQNELT